MRIFKSKWFARFTRKEGISDARLREAMKDAEAGKINCDYGGGVIKQRIARPHEGKSGGYRSIIFFQRGGNAFFVYGFSKSRRENINEDEVREYKEAAKRVFAFSDDFLTELVKKGIYEEVKYDD